MPAKLRNRKTISIRWMLLETRDIQEHRFEFFTFLLFQRSGLIWETCRWHTDYKKHEHVMLSTASWSWSETTSMVNPGTAGISVAAPVIVSQWAFCHTHHALSAPQVYYRLKMFWRIFKTIPGNFSKVLWKKCVQGKRPTFRSHARWRRTGPKPESVLDK